MGLEKLFVWGIVGLVVISTLLGALSASGLYSGAPINEKPANNASLKTSTVSEHGYDNASDNATNGTGGTSTNPPHGGPPWSGDASSWDRVSIKPPWKTTPGAYNSGNDGNGIRYMNGTDDTYNLPSLPIPKVYNYYVYAQQKNHYLFKSMNKSTRAISGVISTNTTWSGAIYVKGAITVDAGATLTILPGTSVYFEKNAGLYVNGVLNALGNNTSPIVFTNSTATAAGFWTGIVVNATHSGSVCNIQYAMISYSVVGIYLNYTLSNYASSAAIDHVIINSTLYGVEAYGVIHELKVTNATISNASEDGALIDAHILDIPNYAGNIIIENNTVYQSVDGIICNINSTSSGVNTISGVNLNIKNNRVFNNVGTGMAVISVSEQDNNAIAMLDLNANISKNAVYNNHDGVLIEQYTVQHTGNITSNTAQIKVSDNNLSKNTNYGLLVYGNASASSMASYVNSTILVIENTLSNNQIGVYINGTKSNEGITNMNVTVMGNDVENNSEYGIVSARSHVVVKNNIIKNNKSPVVDTRTLIYADFSGAFPPVGWTEQSDGAKHWIQSPTNNAGGIAPEADFNSDNNGVVTDNLISNSVSTMGYLTGVLTFKTAVDVPGTAQYVYLQVDIYYNSIWHRVWYLQPTTDYPATTVTIPLNIANGLQTTNFKIKFMFSGNSKYINDWYIDNVSFTVSKKVGAGVYFGYNTTATLYNNTIENNAPYGIYTDWTSKSNWVVSGTSRVEHNSAYLNGNISVKTGGKLTMSDLDAHAWNVNVENGGCMEVINGTPEITTRNVSVSGTLYVNGTMWKIDCTHDGQYHIVVNSTGHMFVYSLGSTPSIITHKYENINYEFWVERGSEFRVSNSKIEFVGWDNTKDNYRHMGLWINTDNALIDHATFFGGYYDLMIYKSAPVVKNSMFNMSIGHGGIYTLYSSAKILNNTFYRGPSAILQSSSDVFYGNVVWCHIYAQDLGLEIYNPNATRVERNIFEYTEGIWLTLGHENSGLIIDNNTIKGGGGTAGIWISGESSAKIADNNITGFYYGVVSSSGDYLSGGIKYSGVYKLTYLPFGFECINGAATRNELIKNIMAWFGNPASVLLVDDDKGAHYESYYNASLSAIGYGPSKRYYWDVSKQGTPPSDVLEANKTVIWFTGSAYGVLNASDRASIQSFLSNGGNLFISSPSMSIDAYYNHWYSWYKQWMRATLLTGWTPPYHLEGDGDAISGHMVLNIHPLSGDGADYTTPPITIIRPYNGSSEIFHYIDVAHTQIVRNNIFNNTNGTMAFYAEPDLINNNISSNLKHGLCFEGKNVSLNLINNRIYNNGKDGIYVASSNSLKLDSESIYENKIYLNHQVGVEVKANGGVTVSLVGNNNEIYNNNMSGIYIYTNGSANITLSNNIIGNGGDGVYVKAHTTILKIIGMMIKNNAKNGIYVEGKALSLSVLNSSFSSNDMCGIYLNASGSMSINIQSATVNSNILDGLRGYALGAISAQISNSEFYGNKYGVILEANNAENVNIKNTSVSENRFDGLHLYAQKVSGNIDGITAKENNYNGTYIANGENLVLNGSYFEDNGIGLALEYSDMVTIDSSFISNNKIGGYAIYAVDMALHENTIAANTQYGLYVEHASRVIVDNNALSKNGIDGLYMYDSNNVTVSGNNIEESVNGLSISNSRYITIYSNNISENTNNGIYLNEMQSSDISNNSIISNYYNGTSIYNCDKINVADNYITGNYQGVYIYHSAASLRDNNIVYNLGTSGDDGSGVWLAGAHVTLYNNNISYNLHYGLYSDDSSVINWYVTSIAEVCANPMYIRGNIYVENGGTMNLQNIKGEFPDGFKIGVYILSERAEQFGIYVSQSGILNIENTFITSSSFEPYKFEINGTFNMYSSIVEYMYDVDIWSSNVTISGSVVRDGWYGGIEVHSSRPYIQATKIENNTYFGIMLVNMAQPSLDTVDIRDNGVALLLNNTRNLELKNISLISNNIGVKATTHSEFYLINSTVSSNGNDFYIEGNTTGYLINTNFNENSAVIRDNSVLTVSWYLNVKVLDRNGTPLANVQVSIYNSENALVATGHTNIIGELRWIVVKEYIETSSEKQYYTPTKVLASVNGENFTQGVMVSATTTVTIDIKNRAPSIISTPNRNATQGEEYRYAVEAEDPDGDTLTYALLAGPKGMSIDSTTGVITWVPTNADVGSHYVVVRVSDGHGGYAEQSFTLNVTNVNDPPILRNAQVSPHNGSANMEYVFAVMYSDPDGDLPLHVYVVIDGKEYVMTNEGGRNATSGLLYVYNGTLTPGAHTYYFEAQDGHGGYAHTAERTLYVSESQGTKASGTDVWLYVIVALLVVLIALTLFDMLYFRSNRTLGSLWHKEKPANSKETPESTKALDEDTSAFLTKEKIDEDIDDLEDL